MEMQAAVVGWGRQLQLAVDEPAGRTAADLIDLIGALESLKSISSAAQAHWTAQFAALREAELAALPSREDDRGASVRRDVGAQIGLARRVSPRVGTRLVGLAKVLTAEMPSTMAALRGGRIDEYQALIVVGETATLTREHRQAVDAELASRFGTMSPGRARAEAARIGYRLDPEQAVRRARKAAGDRCVTLRPAPDTMSYLTALLPAVDGVAAYAALMRNAAAATAHGDPRGRGALMADALVAQLIAVPAADGPGSATPSGQPRDGVDGAGGADAGPSLVDGLGGLPAGVNLEIQLVMTDRALFDGDHEPAILTGYGPIPAPLARHLARGADPHTTTWVRRLYTDPAARISDADSRRRLFPHPARQLLVARDQVCRTPWCGAPIRHADHTRAYVRGGPTTVTNGAGRCVACNLTKETSGWAEMTDADGTIVITTPTGHRHSSHPPPSPRSAPWPDGAVAPAARSA